jgi:hypothetical protein
MNQAKSAWEGLPGGRACEERRSTAALRLGMLVTGVVILTACLSQDVLFFRSR